MKVTSPKQKPQKFLSTAASKEQRRATKIEQNLEMAVVVAMAVAVGGHDSHKQDRNVTESKRRVEREGRKKEGREGGQRVIRMLFSVAVRSVSFDVV